ncbi:hypothetical protein ACHAQH_008386 [Verticillium albo-atrum]
MALVASSSSAVPSSGPEKSLEDAVAGFQSILTSDECTKLATIGAIRDPETFMTFTAQMDRENQLNKGKGVASRIIRVLESVQQFSGVVETYISSNPKIAALIWGSVKMALLKGNGLRTVGHKQLANAVWRSFKEEFKPYVDDIQGLAKEVQHEIHLAKALVDRQDRELQEKEREIASKERSAFRKFIPVTGKKLETIQKLQVQQATRLSQEDTQRLLDSLSSHDHIAPYREACKKRQWIRTILTLVFWEK